MSKASDKWKALTTDQQWATIFNLLSDVRRREIKIATWKGLDEGGVLDKAKAKELNEVDRAILDLLKPATPRDVWGHAERAARNP